MINNDESIPYYLAELQSHKTQWYDSKGYLAIISNKDEEACVEKLEYCGHEISQPVWAAGTDNSDHHNINQWMWKSINGPTKAQIICFRGSYV